MYDHNSSVYYNNCLRVPRNPKNDHPQTQFDQKFLHDLHNEVTKSFNEKMKADLLSSAPSDVKAFIDFYDSIPEYDEINHLSNREFYKKLDNLKEKQREFCDYLNHQLQFDTKGTAWISDYKALKTDAVEKNKPAITTPYYDDENVSMSDKDPLTKPPSRRSVRIETPSIKSSPDMTPDYFRSKSRVQSADQKTANDWADLRIENLNLDCKSAPSSPLRRPKSVEDNNKTYDGITVPKPFQMTVRDEENKIVEELFLKINKPKEKPHHQQFKAHDVPIESQIPLFDKIMDDQHRRSLKQKEKRKADLQAQMRPFSFTRRDEEIQELTKRFSKSLPCVYNDEAPLKIKKFKAKPIPKNLFSNYIYKKMHEDEFYRALQKKVRAEEMLKHASLPPSMAKREKSKPTIDVCPRSFRDLQTSDVLVKKHRKIPDYKSYHDKYERELEELKNEFISTSPRPFKLKSAKREKRVKRNCHRTSSAMSRSSSGTQTNPSVDRSSITRANLAAVLRIQSARKRSEMEQKIKIIEEKQREEAQANAKKLRKKPAFKVLDYSLDDDLAMRLELRKDEARLRREKYKVRMEMMHGRVNQQLTLLERQCIWAKSKCELAEQQRPPEKSRSKTKKK